MAFLLLTVATLVPVLAVRAQPPFEGRGRVIALDESNRTVTLDHGPIPGFMPPMRMRFPVLDVEQLRKLKAGDEVRFSVGNRGDEMIIVTIERLEEQPPAPR